MRRLPELAALVAALVVGGCASTQVPSLVDPAARYGIAKDERKLIALSDDFEAELYEEGRVFEDSDLQAYVDAIGSRLVPAAAGEKVAFRFAVLRDPWINAFAMGNGAILLHTGLLAHLENEAQLAHVMAHEITHTVERHQLKSLRSYQNKTVLAKVGTLILAPVAAVFGGGGGASLASTMVQLAHAASVSGYGRELEEEADLQGIVAIAEAGYRTEEAPRLFALLNEIEEPGALAAFFYADHPANAARAAYTRELLETGRVPPNPEGQTGADAYRDAVRSAAVENIRLRIRAKHYAFALKELEIYRARYGEEDPVLHYQLAEAHRRIAEDPRGAATEDAMRARESVDEERIEAYRARAEQELEISAAEYARALELDPSMALAHRGLGLVAYDRGDRETAREELQRYLEEADQIRDRRYIERILREVSQ
ncbi:MAG: M48 family metalloprotease [Deltaproteobacteria bacterium]|nr:MAG: M48 family metalloprotease [Deltaproteobacteria bacterium]